MKTKLINVIIFLASNIFCYSQSDTSFIHEAVQDIKNNLSTFKKIEKINTDKGTRFVFLKDKELKLITVNGLGPDIEKKVEWYYVNGQMAYIETNWVNTKTKNNVYQEKHYFSKGHLIAWLNPQKQMVDIGTVEFKKMDSELTAYGIKIKNEALQ
jgi:hypothetical protein